MLTTGGKFFWFRSVTRTFMNSLVPIYIWSGLPQLIIALSRISSVKATTLGSFV